MLANTEVQYQRLKIKMQSFLTFALLFCI